MWHGNSHGITVQYLRWAAQYQCTVQRLGSHCITVRYLRWAAQYQCTAQPLGRHGITVLYSGWEGTASVPAQQLEGTASLYDTAAGERPLGAGGARALCRRLWRGQRHKHARVSVDRVRRAAAVRAEREEPLPLVGGPLQLLGGEDAARRVRVPLGYRQLGRDGGDRGAGGRADGIGHPAAMLTR